MTVNIGINGFGRIGKSIVRGLIKQNFPVNLVAINELGDIKTNAHLLKYDSVHGRLDADIKVDGDKMLIDSKPVAMTQIRNPNEIGWDKFGVDIVLECTGIFTAKEKANLHIQGGAKKVIISAPAPDPDVTIAYGINTENYDPANHHIISNASCTTNCLAPVAKVIHEKLNIKSGTMTTVHSYTNDQRILDVSHSDLRRARAAAVSQIPTKTGAAKAVGLVLPDLNGKIDGMAIRVPTPNVSCVDFVSLVEKETSADEVNQILKEASENELKGVLGYSDEPLVSCDYNGDTRSSIIDGLSTKVMGGNLVKILTWYDNETGFSNRMIDMAQFIGDKI